MAEEHFFTVRDLLDELVWYELGGMPGIKQLHLVKLLGVEPIADVFRLRVGFRVRYEDWCVTGDPVFTKDLWIRQRDAKVCGAWGRALSTPEGRSYVAEHWMGSSYWLQDSPRDEQYDVVLFDP